jgi:peptide/nickel transport system permease protein
MTAYFTRRILISLLTLVMITMIVYGLIRNMPGTPLTLDLAETDPSKRMTDQDIALLNKAYGLDEPVGIAYFKWIGNVLRGDLGNSFRYRTSVTDLIREKLGPTLLLSVTSLVITYLASIPFGLFATARSGRWDERLVSILFYALYSLPGYVAGIALLYVFFLQLEGTAFHLVPGMRSDEHASLGQLAKMWDIAKHLILPLICYSYSSLAYDVRFIKANMEEAIRQDYIRTARAKGLDEATILYRHAFRNTLIPFVTLLGLTLPSLIGGAIIIEQIFSWPGIGSLYYEALTFRDYPIIMGVTFFLAVATLVGQLLADFLYAMVDPRVTYQ